MSNDITVYKDNQLIEASYKLSLIEQRLMLFCIGQLKPTLPEKKQVIFVEDFIKAFPLVDKSKVYSQIKSAIDTIYERTIRVKKPKSIKEFRWIQYKEYKDDQGIAVIEFSDHVLPYLCQLEQQFTQYQLRHVSGFKRTYSIRLYELLTQYRNLKKRSITIEDLRNLLLLGDKFKTIKNLKARVIDPAINEINEKSDLIIAYTQTKKGRSVYSFEFSISINPDIEFKEKKLVAEKHLREIKRKTKKRAMENDTNKS